MKLIRATSSPIRNTPKRFDTKPTEASPSNQSSKPLSLLLLTDSMDDGGAQTHILTLTKALRAHGCNVTVASSGGRLIDKLSSQGVAHVMLPPCRLPFLFRMRRRLKQICRERQIDCIHAHARFPAFAANRVAHRSKIPMVTTVHAHFRSDPIRRRLSRWGIRTIAVSEDLRQYLCEEYGICPNNITVIPNGIERAPAPPTCQSEAVRLVFCSRLDHDCSAVAFLLCAIAERLRFHFPTLQILLIGGGSALPSLKKQAQEINQRSPSPFLFFTGAVERPTEHMRASDIFVGVSRAALEAMSIGLPTVLAGNEGFIGVLDEGTISLACRSNFCCRGEKQADAERLFSACFSLLSRPEEERKRLGRFLCDYVQVNHSIDACAEKTLRVYREVLAPYPKASTPQTLVLCGYYGYGNMGDDTLLQAALARAERDYPSHSIAVLVAPRARRTPILGVRLVCRSSPLAVLLCLRRAELLIFGGGTLLQDTTSLRSLLYYATLLRYAQKRGARCELWANGLSRPRTAIGTHVMRDVLGRCERIGLRDVRSITLAKTLGANEKKTVREDDLGLGLGSAEQERIDFLIHRYRLKARFAVVAPKGGADQALVARLQAEIEAFEQKGITVLLVALFPKEDGKLCRQLLTPNRRLAQHVSAGDLIGLMARSVGVLGMRLHALIFAKNAEVFFVGLGKDEKLQSFCAEQGAPCLYE